MMTPESHVLHLSTSVLPIAGEFVYSLVVDVIFIIQAVVMALEGS